MTQKLTFLQSNDIHWRVANPRARLDDYNTALKNKITELFALAEGVDAEAVLIPGDITDTPGLGLAAIAELAWLLSQSPCPLLTIAGQHDEWGHNPETLYRTPYGMLRRLGYIVDVAVTPQWFTAGGRRIRVTGRHYDETVDRTEDYYEMPPLDPSDRETVTIHLAHGLVVEQAPGFDLRCTPLKALKTSADVLCVGDYHPGIGIQKAGNTVVINPGALGRLAASASDMERQVQIAKIEIDDEGNIETSLIPLTSAQPGHIVLSREHLEAEAEREERINNFLSLLSSDTNLKFLETREIIEQIAQSDQLPEMVVAEALKRLGRAREELGAVER